ncbi:hypothetical protein SISNIDRAFT_471078 [Sistotremastrum niveocremeum HHB9708]|uniref:Nucleoplasmin-like domain-containing protein n=1 Tax=Sistotremastrum niveocremeum HHB9708 TaxID=1314777 RepID=A0A164N3U2_9AGAM|nr:hypothetical protein SISNIDRAFT_471078 [Sistotremastrum niveocremeum HHB9708]
MASSNTSALYFFSIDAAAGQPVRFQPTKPLRLTNACINEPKSLDWTIIFIEHSNARGFDSTNPKIANRQRITKESPICWLRPGDVLEIFLHMSATFDIVLSPQEEVILRLKNSHGGPEVSTITIAGYYMDAFPAPISLSHPVAENLTGRVDHDKGKTPVGGFPWRTTRSPVPSASLKRLRSPSPQAQGHAHKRMRGIVTSPLSTHATQSKTKAVASTRSNIERSRPGGTQNFPPSSRSHMSGIGAGPSFSHSNSWAHSHSPPAWEEPVWGESLTMDFGGHRDDDFGNHQGVGDNEAEGPVGGGVPMTITIRVCLKTSSFTCYGSHRASAIATVLGPTAGKPEIEHCYSQAQDVGASTAHNTQSKTRL